MSGGWNHRVIKQVAPSGEVFYGIHEVYYDKYGPEGVPVGCTEDPVGPAGETPEELREDLQRFLAALDKPVLNWEDIVKPNPVSEATFPTADGYRTLEATKYTPVVVSREEVIRELGDPSTWDEEEEALMKEFHARSKK